MMRSLKQFFTRYWFKIGVIFILALAILLRFANYYDRWGLAYDQSHDALLARYAIDANKLPLLGPFSSAGPFQTGGEWYWLIMLGSLLYRQSLLTPWVFITLLYVLFVLLIIFFAKELVDKKFGLFVGILAAVSPAQITQGTNLTNQTPLALFSLFSLWFAIRFTKNRKLKYLFLLGLSVGTAASIHLQGAGLITLAILTLFIHGIPKIREVVVLAAGLSIPWIPVFIVDLQNNFFNTKNIIRYHLQDQYKISLDVLGRRWLTYAFVFWPKIWGFVIGGNILLGYVSLIGIWIISAYNIFKKSLSKEWIVMLVSFFGMITILRYTRTPLFESYIVFLHPFILLFTGRLIFLTYQSNHIMGLLLLLIFLAGSIQKDIHEITSSGNLTADEVSKIRKVLIQAFPDKELRLYDYKYQLKDKSFPLALFLSEQNKIADNGVAIGMTATDEAHFNYPVIYGKGQYIKIFDLRSAKERILQKQGWGLVTPREVYRTTQEWYK